MKIDNLVEQIKNMKESLKRKTDEIENMKMNQDSLKEDISLNNKKMNNLELQNKKLNIEYENLNKDFQNIKNEKEKMEHELEECKAKIFNYQKELSTNNKKNNKLKSTFDYDNYNYVNMNNLYNKKQDYLQDNLNEIIQKNNTYNDELINNRNDYKKEYNEEDLYKYEDQRYSNINKENNLIDKAGFGLKKKKYSNYDLENFKSIKKPLNSLNSLPDLQTRLTYLISEKKTLENELLKMPEHPRNLNEIKIKKELNIKISDTEQEINSIRARIRNFNY
jgi:chromosome segregation ATPase